MAAGQRAWARLLLLGLLLTCTAPTSSDNVAAGPNSPSSSSSASFTLHCAYHGFSRHARAQHGPGQISGLYAVYAGVRVTFPSALTLRDLSEGAPPVDLAAAGPGALAGLIGLRCGRGGGSSSPAAASSTTTALPWHLIPLPRPRTHGSDSAWASSPSRPDRLLDALETVLGRRQPRTADAVDAMLMLRYHDSTGIIAESPVWKRPYRAENGQPHLPLSSCKLTFPRCSEQRFWPAKFLTVQESGGNSTLAAHVVSLAGTEHGPLAYRRNHQRGANTLRPRSPITLHLSPHTSRAALSETANSAAASASKSFGSWQHGNMPGVGDTDLHLSRYCDVASLTPKQRRALRAVHETSLIQTGSALLGTQEGGTGIPGLKSIMEFTTKLVLAPLMTPATRMMTGALGSEMGKETGPQMNSDTPNELVAQLSPTLAFNVGNLLPDALAYRVGKDSAREILKAKEKGMAWDIHAKIMKDLPARIARQLGRTIPQHLYERLPRLLESSVPGMLVGELTGTVTHTLPIAIAAVIGKSKSTKQEGLEYVSTYYADFYSSYYRQYYQNVYRVERTATAKK